MALDLKPLSEEVIQNMGYASHDLWLVKIDEQVFGPFEVASLKDYASENSVEFHHAQVAYVGSTQWCAFFSHPVFHPIIENKSAHARYWVLDKGQKQGPFSRHDVDKKLEMGILAMTDLVSDDEGHTWNKFFQMETFNSEAGAKAETLPSIPLEASFQRSREEIAEWMNNQKRPHAQSAIADLMYMGQKKEGTVSLKLEEMDLKSLETTEVSRSLKWAIPTAVASVGVLVALGNFILTPSSEVDVALVSETSEVIRPKRTVASNPNPSMPVNAQRVPASYVPQEQSRSALTHAPPMDAHYPPAQIETHVQDEPDPMIDPISEAEPPQEMPQEHSLVNNNNNNGSEAVDSVISGAPDDAPAPEQPVMDESGDF